MLFNELDSRTFFKTAALILEHKAEANFKDLPHILMANKNDNTLDYDYIIKTFTKNINLLLVVNTTIDHFPLELTKTYFKTHLPETVTGKVYRFMSNVVKEERSYSGIKG